MANLQLPALRDNAYNSMMLYQNRANQYEELKTAVNNAIYEINCAITHTENLVNTMNNCLTIDREIYHKDDVDKLSEKLNNRLTELNNIYDSIVTQKSDALASKKYYEALYYSYVSKIENGE